jgi:Domain of unknown function (DUF4911)
MQNNHLQTLFIRIRGDRYHFLKFILEGYDGLAIMTKVHDEIVLLRYPLELYEDLLHLLSSLTPKIRCSYPFI